MFVRTENRVAFIDHDLISQMTLTLQMSPGGLEKMLCNATLFHKMVTNSSTAIQQELCAASESGDLSVLLGFLDMGKLVEQVGLLGELNLGKGKYF